jgi:hypothetical protein
MMRTREQIRAHCIKLLHEEQNPHERAFKLFMVDVELQLDIRDLLVVIAQGVAPSEYEELKKVVDARRRT